MEGVEMTVQAKELNEWVALVGRIITPLGIVALIFLQTQFASKAEIQKVIDGQKEFASKTEVKELKIHTQKLETAVTLLVEQQKRMIAYDMKLEAFEDRLRQVEILIAKHNK